LQVQRGCRGGGRGRRGHGVHLQRDLESRLWISFFTRTNT
jgi:hypothetical protein